VAVGGPESGGARHTRGGVRLALGVLVIAGTALSAVLLRPEGQVTSRGSGPLDGNLPVLLLAAAWFGIVLKIHNRYWGRIDHDRELTPLEQRLVDIVRVSLLAAVFIVPLLLLALHRFSSSGQATGKITDTRHDDIVVSPKMPSTPPVKPHHGKGHGFPHVLLHILLGLGIGLLVLALVVAAVLLWRYLRMPEARQDGPGYEAVDDDRELLAEAVDSGRRALRGGDDARAAVIACYAAMETSLAASGVARRASDSPRDLLERVVSAGRLTGPSAAALTALFREARYSTHPMGDSHRDRAAEALHDIAAQLAAHQDASEDRTGAGPDDSGPGTGGTGRGQGAASSGTATGRRTEAGS
jgi:hypothetical protein